ncbi:Rha family transcriptional regulator [Bacillus pumilus]|uniref:Rha family transcriptional regulator n=1 Tax=Bacillus pumilus TaxID=1408 RepID=UPI003000B30D
MKEEDFVTDSKLIADEFGKRHDSVIRTIESIIKKEKFYARECSLSQYKDTTGRKLKMYALTKKGRDRLYYRYQFGAYSPRLEKAFGEWLEKFFGEKLCVEKQRKVGKYRLDFFIPKFSLIIEYDEKEHEFKRESDIHRQKEINTLLKDSGISPMWIRVKEGMEIEGIREILHKLDHISKDSIMKFIN